MNTRIRQLAIPVIVSTLAACGGGSGTSTSSVPPSAPPTISGLAASGNAIANAPITAKCVGGAALSGTTNASGNFSLQLNGQTTPCMLQVTNGAQTLNSFAAATGNVNVTPLTDLVVTKAMDADPNATFTNFTAITAGAINAGLAAAKAYVIAEVTPLAGSAPTGDPLTMSFQVGDVNDKLLDNLAAALSAGKKGLADLRVAAANGTSLNAVVNPEEVRPHDSYAYAPSAADAAATTFPALPAASGDVVDMSTTSRWAGVLHNAAYHIEVPANWNGKLVMYAHGYVGEGLTLAVSNPSIRRHLIQLGYAWAASSYSKNSYDVRAGIEDTNALALAFPKIAALNSRQLTAPSKTYIIGVSMGGHVTAAAMEDETYATANNKQKYNAALPMCGVVGDAELFNTFAAEQLSAQALSGYASNPYDSWGTIKAAVTTDLFAPTFPAAPITPTTPLGQQYYSVVENLTGGDRPIFDIGFADGGSLLYPYTFFGVDPINLGLLTKEIYDTNEFNGANATRPYTVDGNASVSAMLNSTAQVLTAQTDVNRLRTDGLRWLPLVNGQFHAPVVTLHTLGDLFVPFHMEQVYRARANTNNNGSMLVQRAIRGATHCDFTIAEQVAAFDAMIAWESNGTVPAGDDVATPATVAASSYGCAYTNNSVGPDDTNTAFNSLRQVIVAAHPCPQN